MYMHTYANARAHTHIPQYTDQYNILHMTTTSHSFAVAVARPANIFTGIVPIINGPCRASPVHVYSPKQWHY